MTKETALDIDWLVARCLSLHAHLKKPSRAELVVIKEKLTELVTDASLSDGHALESITSLKDIIRSLFAHIGVDAPIWLDSPKQDALPMVALIPGIGCRVLYAKTHDGHWLMEGPGGSTRLHQLPLDGQYAAIMADDETTETPTAILMFKNILLAHKNTFVHVVMASFLANLVALAASLYSMQVYDRVIPTQGVSTLMVLTVGVLFATVFELAIKMMRSAMLRDAICDIDLILSHKIFLRLLGIRMDQFPASVGTLSAQLRSYETIRNFAFSITLYLAVDAPFALLFLAVIAMLAGIHIALIPAVFFGIALLVGTYYRDRIADHAKTGSVASNAKLGLLVETVENAESIKATGSGWQLLTRWDAINRQAARDDLKIRYYSEQAAYLAAFMQQISYIFLIAGGAWVAATSTDLTTGGLIACSILSGRVLGPVTALPGLVVQWAHAKAALDSLEQVFALQRDNHQVTRPLIPEHIAGHYQLRDMHFSYPARPETLSIAQLIIQPGEKIGILGSIGAGKSTLLKLLAGLYVPNSGSVLLDGLEMQQISRAHLSERLAYLPQDVRLFSGTLRDNLLHGLSGISEKDVLAACKITGLIFLVSAHPKGLDLRIAEGGSGVSGGQKQLIALTRFILCSPDVWLLDEPTAAMDDYTEQRSLHALSQAVLPHQTLVLITHKPSLLKLVQRVIVLSPQGIVMDGPRDAVLEKLRHNPQAASVKPSEQAAAKNDITESNL